MDPISITLLVLAGLVGGGAALYKEKPALFAKIPLLGSFMKPPTQARSITLDAAMPDADKQAVIAAIMSGKNASDLTALAQKYSQYPWAAFELNYRAWELGGKQGAAPLAPAGGTASTQVPTPAPVTQTPADLAAAAAAVAQTALNSGTAQPSIPSADSASNVPQPPFNLSGSSISGAWKSDATYIKQYQSALTYLADKESSSFNPGAIDGQYGPNTQAAVKAFQQSRGLSPVDGEAGPATAKALAIAVNPNKQLTGAQGGYETFNDAASLAEQVAGTKATEFGSAGGRASMMEQIAGTKSTEFGSAGGRASAMEQIAGRPVDLNGPGAAREGVGVRPGDIVGATAAGAVAATFGRPVGTPFMRIRETDSVFPRTITEIGTGIKRGSPSAIKHLADINPHLAPDGIIPELRAGMELNVPPSWAAPLKKRGFDVYSPDGSALS